MISIEDFKKIDIAVGEIIAAEKVPETDKLLKLTVNLGPAAAQSSGPLRPSESVASEAKEDIRQIISGISLYFPDCTVLVLSLIHI